MTRLGLETEILDSRVLERTAARFREAGVVLPTFAEIQDPAGIPPRIAARLSQIDPDAPHPLNLFRVHWMNGADRRTAASVPEHLVLPEALTGVPAKIVVLLGNRFPMIRAHKVLAAYGCLVPRLVTGQFDPTVHRAIWPSTGNYCRGGVAISRILGCRGVAVLPERMSEERFQWLERWVADPSDIIRTPGCESNVKEIYDKCGELDRDPANVIFNQFCEFGNYLVHYTATGRALEKAFEALAARERGLTLAAFVSATGSAGTLAAGDYLKERHGSRTVAVEALECPTLSENGFGDHNIQGIGDKHVPYIHNVMATDFVVALSDASTDSLGVLFDSETGRAYLRDRRGIRPELASALTSLGLSSIANVLAAAKTAKYLGLGEKDVLVTVATDGGEMYGSERAKALAKHFPRGFDAIAAAETFGRHALGAGTDHVFELGTRERNRIFNLGYFTWVEQQDVPLDEFEARRRQGFWKDLRSLVPAWDERIRELNARTGVAEKL
ncbi:MAG: pyridoxal-phosphate dependent enzyme [Planctomycetes bacterium]|nr:pyridoxal-phosphate dependent enzyme [Planctomycetota bacterium]